MGPAEGRERPVLVLYLPGCHEKPGRESWQAGSERYWQACHHTDGCREGIKGSGRSIEAYNMYEEPATAEDLLTKFGGHKLAAECPAKENIEEPKDAQ